MNISNENLFRAIGNHLYPEVEFFVKNSDGVYVFVNDYFTLSTNLYNLKAINVNLVGLKDIDVFDTETSSVIRKNDLHVLNTGEKIDAIEFVKKPFSNIVLKFHARKWLLLDDDNKKYILGVCHNITVIVIGGMSISLSDRQIETLSGVYFGHSAKEIAKRLNISYRTIETYINQLKDKLNVDAKKDFVKIINENKLHNAMTYFYKYIENKKLI